MIDAMLPFIFRMLLLMSLFRYRYADFSAAMMFVAYCHLPARTRQQRAIFLRCWRV